MGNYNSLFICGLRRSGTTILWQSLCKHPQLLGFDEPFHPRLWLGDTKNSKGTWSELTRLWKESPTEFCKNVEPISVIGEVDANVTDEQILYLQKLFSLSKHVVIDEVRCWNKMREFARANSNTHFVHIVRNPVSWSLSHLLPSGSSGWKFFIGTQIRKITALSRCSNFDNWQYETIIRELVTNTSWFSIQSGLSGKELAKTKAYIKLLAFWWIANRRIYTELNQQASCSYSLVLAEDFMCSPRDVCKRLLEKIELREENIEFSDVVSPKFTPLHYNVAWARAFSDIGLSERLLPGNGITSAVVLNEFKKSDSCCIKL